MKPTLITLLMILQLVYASGQDTLTLENCYTEAKNNWPEMKEKEILEKANQLKQKDLRSNWFPVLDVNGQVTYQSDVISFDLPIPNFTMPELAKDHYKISLDVKQVLLDGGVIKSLKELETLNLSGDVQKVEVKLYQLKERINAVYFAVLLLQEKEKLLNTMSNEIQERLKVVESAVRNGVIMQSDADILRAEQLKFEQQVIELHLSRVAAFEVLGKLLNKQLPENTVLQLPPPVPVLLANNKQRPEYAFLDIQTNRLSAYSKLVSKKRYPRLFGFGQFGYGRPAFDMLSNDFDPFYIVGAQLTWNLWDWNKNHREKQGLLLQKEIVTTQKETLDKNLNILSEKEFASINKYEKLMEKDEEIINLRSSISKKAASQLDNGVITSTDYLSVFNAETQARVSLETHKIQLAQAKVNYQTIIGNE